ncbi:MAG: BadF/BadG/BcrA/BcrD ATPase family protein [Candidatus Binatia bacterium]
MIVGIDIGGSTTDAVLLNGGEIVVVTIETGDPLAAAAGALGKLLSTAGGTLTDIRAIAASGGGARFLQEQLFGVPVVNIPEISAIGVGGSTLAEKSEALVVSLGTGTALVSVRDGQIEHVGGTGIGGGTLLGLARHLLGVTRLDTVEQLAAHGDLSRVDLTVGDITGGPVGIVPASATASNFGKIRADPTQADKALALVNMVAEVTFTVSLMAARARQHQDIVLTGKLTRVKPLRDRLEAMQPRRGENLIIPPHAEYATAIGAARAVHETLR